MIKVKSYGDNLSNGNYSVHSRFKRAVNFVSGRAYISIVTEDIGPGPQSIVVEGVDLGELNELVVGSAGFVINGERFVFVEKKQFHSDARFSKKDPEIIKSNLEIIKEILIKNAPPLSLAFLLDGGREGYFKSSYEIEFLKRFKNAHKTLFNDASPLTGVCSIKGSGFGFTPSGDDYIAGFLMSLYTRQKIYNKNHANIIEEIYNAALGTNPVSNGFLYCASHGKLSQKFKDFVEAVFLSDKKNLLKTTKTILNIGETSGTDFCVGFLMGLRRRPKWL